MVQVGSIPEHILLQIDMCAGMRIGSCTSMRINVCTDMCIDMRRDLCIDTCKDMSRPGLLSDMANLRRRVTEVLVWTTSAVLAGNKANEF